MNVGQLISLAFNVARSRQRDFKAAWTKISWRIGSRLPGSMLVMSVQRLASLDAVLRCMEDDLDLEAEKSPSVAEPYTDHLTMLSELWVGMAYEILRLLKARELVSSSNEFDALAHDLRLLRVTLEKHEIAADRKLKAPLAMAPVSPRKGETTVYHYDPKDPRKAHRMPVGISSRGSAMWQAVDTGSITSRWIERRDLSERLTKLWDEGQPSHETTEIPRAAGE